MHDRQFEAIFNQAKRETAKTKFTNGKLWHITRERERKRVVHVNMKEL